MPPDIRQTLGKIRAVLIVILDDGYAEALVVRAHVGVDGVQVADYPRGELVAFVSYLRDDGDGGRGAHFCRLGAVRFHHCVEAVCAAVGADCCAG